MLNLVGGLWASDINADYGWKEWTENNDFMTGHYSSDNYFKFKLKDNARILHLKDEKDLKNLPKNNSEIARTMRMCGTEYLDVNWYGHKMQIDINFCPMCGRKL